MTTPLFMRDVSLTLKLTTGSRLEFNCDAHTAEILTEPGDVVEYQTLCPDGSFSNQGKSTYALHVVAAQDWSATGLARFLWENAGELAEFQYQPHGHDVIPPTDDMPGMHGFCRLIEPAMGGEADTFAELDVEMPCSTKPTLAVAAFPAILEAGKKGKRGCVMVAKMTVRGIPETERAFSQLQSDVSNLQDTHKKVAQARLDGVKRRTPVDTGALAGSWQASASSTAGSIISPLQHAMAQEYGTQFVSAARMVKQTLEAEEGALLKEYGDSILERGKARGFRIG